MSLHLPVYFKNAAATLRQHPAGYVVFEYQPGKRAFPEFRAALQQLSNLLRRTGWCRILGDQRLMAPFTEEETAYVTTYWLAEGQHSPGGLYAAVLLANDVFARLSATQLRHDNKAAALTYRLFDSETEAAAWLTQLA